MPDDDGPQDNVHTLHKAPRRAKSKCTPLTVSRALRIWPELHSGRLFKLDTFSGETLLVRALLRPDIEPPAHWEVTPITDIHVTWLMEILEAGGMDKVTRTVVDYAIQAEGQRNHFSAPLEQLESLPAWDGVARLDDFWIKVCGTEVASEGMTEREVYERLRYLSSTARAFFIGIVARIMRPGCKLDTVVILEGPEGRRKSTLFRILAFGREAWFSDSMPSDLSGKDARAHLSGRLIIELAELLSVKGSTVEGVKAFLSAQDDKFRPAYGRHEEVRPRQCVFVGTTNSDRYLASITGNRRFWPIKCGVLDLELAEEIMPQLYAEALQAYRDGEPWWLKDAVEGFAAKEQEARRVLDPLEEFIAGEIEVRRRAAKGRGDRDFFVSTGDLLKATESGTGARFSEASYTRIGRILVKFGGINRRLHHSDADQRRGYIFRCS